MPRVSPFAMLLGMLLSTQVLPGQPYYAVSILGDTLSGRMTVWRMEEDGTISLHQDIDLPSGAEAVHADPFGRYVLFTTEEGFQNYRLELWRVEADHTLSLADAFSMDGLAFSPAAGELSQDGRWFVDFTGGFSPLPDEEKWVQSFRITEDLHVELGGTPFSVASSEFYNIAGLVIAQPDETVVVASFSTSIVGILEFSFDEFGNIGPNRDPIVIPAGGPQHLSVRSDGRVVVSGLMPLSLGISASGELTHIDTVDVLISLRNAHFLPNGLGLTGGDDMNLVDLNRDGTFPNTFDSLATPGFRGTAVTYDGRFVVYSQDCPGPGECFSVFRPHLGPASLEPVFTLPGQPLWGDIEFIPPRTEALLGDANADGLRNAADIVTYINHFNDDPDIGGPTDPTITGPVPKARADADQDGDIDQDDLDWLIDFLLGRHL